VRIMHTILELRSIQAPRRKPGDLPSVNPSLRDGLPAARSAPRGFTLTELLVAIGIVLVLVSIVSAAVAAARGSQRKQSTVLLIDKIDAIIQEQYTSYESRTIAGATSFASRAEALRRLATCEMPDRWADVGYMYDRCDLLNPSPLTPLAFPKEKLTGAQRAYISLWHTLSATQKGAGGVGAQYSGAECLFMVVTMGGIADCLDCGELGLSSRGDKDGDGMPEFWDSWGNPIGYIIWPGGLQLPAGSGARFFSDNLPFAGGSVGRTMRPLIYSGGPDGITDTDGSFGFMQGSSTSNLAQGSAIGNPAVAPASTFAAPQNGSVDNITNFDAEAKL
jgi:prepilin-type N-terminal cleavage/methylation domain-containing protein